MRSEGACFLRAERALKHPTCPATTRIHHFWPPGTRLHAASYRIDGIVAPLSNRSRTRWGQVRGERLPELMSARAANEALICGAASLALLLSACTSNAEPEAATSPLPTISSPSEPSTPTTVAPSPAASSPSLTADYALTINITISRGKTVPSGEKINVRVGQEVILNVTSDTDAEIHAHIGEDGYELPVRAGKPAKGSFTLEEPGSFEVESHHLEKIIVILNAR
jgi:hypothetical protein